MSIDLVVGVPYHHQGQGLVETRFRGIAAALIATLGGRAPAAWRDKPHLGRIELILNQTHVSAFGGSPFWAMYGREPNTSLSNKVDWTHTVFGTTVNVPRISPNDFDEIIAAHHDQMNKVQGLVLLASSLAQTFTRHEQAKTVKAGDFVENEWVLLHKTAPNRLAPYFGGPYRIVSVSRDKSFVKLRHYAAATTSEQILTAHVSRLLRVDISRISLDEIAAHQVEEGQDVVKEIVRHHVNDDGTIDFDVKWVLHPYETRIPAATLKAHSRANA